MSLRPDHTWFPEEAWHDAVDAMRRVWEPLTVKPHPDFGARWEDFTKKKEKEKHVRIGRFTIVAR